MLKKYRENKPLLIYAHVARVLRNKQYRHGFLNYEYAWIKNVK